MGISDKVYILYSVFYFRLPFPWILASAWGPGCCNLPAVNLSFLSKFIWLFLQQHVVPWQNHGRLIAGFLASQCQLKPKWLNKIQIRQSAVPSTAHMKSPSFGNEIGNVISIEYSDKISPMKCCLTMLKKRNENKALVLSSIKKKRQLYLDSHSSLIIDFITTNEKQRTIKKLRANKSIAKK